jgi:hypothetical protein
MNRQLDLPYQQHSVTSQAAAEVAASFAPSDRQRVLDWLRAHPAGLTDEQLQRALRMNPSTERPRRIELVRASLVVDSGTTRKTRAGVKAVVWIATKQKAKS